MKEKKVYCITCKFIKEGAFGMDICKATSFFKMDSYKVKKFYYKNCVDININNNCDKYKPKCLYKLNNFLKKKKGFIYE